MHLEAHQKPPADLKAVFKKYQKITLKELENDAIVLDSSQQDSESDHGDLHACQWIGSDMAMQVFSHFKKGDSESRSREHDRIPSHDSPQYILAFQHQAMPGLFILPSMIPLDIQKEILARLFHRDLQNVTHKTNVHLHHHLSYPTNEQSFFSMDPSSQGCAQPKDPGMHRPLSVGDFLNKKLRWVTLGGQYDWTNKVYPNEKPPEFPQDLSDFLQGLFTQTRPEAAIVNLYSPGDILSLHRDVSEECDKGLISLSIGCDAIFVVGSDQQREHLNSDYLVLRLRSGDVLYMTESARYAWHGVPKIIPDTCPKLLEDWPYDATEQENDPNQFSCQPWRGWLKSKRINLNVRQMNL